MTLLSVRQLTRRPWFEDRSFELEAGQVLLISGPSGSGKTLLLRALADLDPVDSGEVELHGRPCTAFRPAEWRSRVTYLHQVPVRLPGSVAQNVEQIRGLESQIARHALTTPRILEQVPVKADVLEAPALQLSGGEAQRLALYRALALSPDVLLLDEPTAALDESMARDAERAVLGWVATGGAVLWVTHDRSLATRIGAPELQLP